MLAEVHERRRQSFLDDDPCSLTSGVLEVTRLTGNQVDVGWSRIRTESLKIVANPRYTDALVLRREKEVSTKYKLARPMAADLDVDVAVTYTPLQDRTYAAREQTPTPEGSDPVFVPHLQDESTRAGELADFLTARRWLVSPQIGFGIQVDEPKIFLGLSGGPKFFKLSGGWTWQQVQALGRGQVEGQTPLSSADELSTRDTFINDWYVALAITIDDLPFFKKE